MCVPGVHSVLLFPALGRKKSTTFSLCTLKMSLNSIGIAHMLLGDHYYLETMWDILLRAIIAKKTKYF